MWNGAQNKGTPHVLQSIVPVFHFSTTLGTVLNNAPLINYRVSIYLYCKLLTGFSLLNYTCRVIVSSRNWILNSRGSFSKFPGKILGLRSVNTVYCWEMITSDPMFIFPQMTPFFHSFLYITCSFLHDLSEMILRYQLWWYFLNSRTFILTALQTSHVIYSNCHGQWGLFAAFSYNQTKWHIHHLSP